MLEYRYELYVYDIKEASTIFEYPNKEDKIIL